MPLSSGFDGTGNPEGTDGAGALDIEGHPAGARQAPPLASDGGGSIAAALLPSEGADATGAGDGTAFGDADGEGNRGGDVAGHGGTDAAPDPGEGGGGVHRRADLSGEIISFGINFIVILVALFVVNLATLMLVSDDYGDENALLPLQSFEARAVFQIQRALGYDVELDSEKNVSMPTVLVYPGMEDEDGDPAPELVISGICAGFREMAVMATLVLLVAGVRWRTKFVWAFILCGVIFLENLLRIFLIHPLAMAFGWDFAWNEFHTFFWEYGQLMTIVLLFIVWYLYVAMREPVRPGWSRSELRYPPRPLLVRRALHLPGRRPATR